MPVFDWKINTGYCAMDLQSSEQQVPPDIFGIKVELLDRAPCACGAVDAVIVKGLPPHEVFFRCTEYKLPSSMPCRAFRGDLPEEVAIVLLEFETCFGKPAVKLGLPMVTLRGRA